MAIPHLKAELNSGANVYDANIGWTRNAGNVCVVNTGAGNACHADGASLAISSINQPRNRRIASLSGRDSRRVSQ